MGNSVSTEYNNNKRNLSEFGWKSDIPDFRDHYHKFSSFDLQNSLLTKVDLRDKCPPIYNQGNIGSCTANGIAAAYQFDELKQDNGDVFIPSRLFIYYNERSVEGHINTDSGASIRDGIKSIAKIGVCDETEWGYNTDFFTTKPSDLCYENAKKHRAIKYKRLLQNEIQLKQCLNNGLPVVFGFSVYESMKTTTVAETGIVPMPNQDEKLLGGHCVMLVGYDNDKRRWICRNSWGNSWGDKGYFYMPYEYILNPGLASDFWTVQCVSNE
jgi:C1A family cysteine protease